VVSALVASDKWPIQDGERPKDHRARAYTAADVLVDITTKLSPDFPVSLSIDAYQAIHVHVMGGAYLSDVSAFAHRLGLRDKNVCKVPDDLRPDVAPYTHTTWTGVYDGHEVAVLHIELPGDGR
jgi:hypothetical protein